MNIYLEIPGDASEALRARLSYAFRLFCAIYGHTPVLNSLRGSHADVFIRYRPQCGGTPLADARTVWLSRGLTDRAPSEPAPCPVKYLRRGLATVLHYEPERCLAPDWLGEIFEWASCADEYSVKARDRHGRPAFAATYAGRHGVDIRVPHAAIAMRGLQQEICRVLPRAEETPRAPQDDKTHFVIPTHDIDYFPRGRAHAAARLMRNALISSLLGRRPLLGVSQAWQGLSVAFGLAGDPLDRLASLALQEQQCGIRSSYYFLARHAHRLDAGYNLLGPGVLDSMRGLEKQGMEIGLHGSYTSLDDGGQLERERDSMQSEGVRVRGSRQHWLRFTLDRLIPEVENAGLDYDTSIGWSTEIGFRAGACFAFPPYNFLREAPAGFLEFPLVVMDQALRGDGQQFHEVAQLIAASRRWGWGGISLLWHPAAFCTAWLPREIGDMYWRLAEDGARFNDCWIKASSFLEIARRRFVEAGLLPAAASSYLPLEIPLPASAGQRRAEPSLAPARAAVSA